MFQHTKAYDEHTYMLDESHSFTFRYQYKLFSIIMYQIIFIF